jgi:hypothetical protein
MCVLRPKADIVLRGRELMSRGPTTSADARLRQHAARSSRF